jgi:Uma2 family endonuclease
MLVAHEEQSRYGEWPRRHRWDADAYEAMGRIGVLKAEDHVELIDGEIFHQWPEAMPRAVRKFTTDEYETLARAEILRPEDHVELIDGDIIEMTPIGESHSAVVSVLANLLPRLLPDSCWLRVQSPIRLSNGHEPEPDIAVVKVDEFDYSERHPSPQDVLLVVEVGQSSVAFDRQVKLPLYATAGVPEVWLVDIAKKRIECFWRPEGNRYAEYATVDADGIVASRAIPAVSVSAAKLFRRRS